MAGNDAAAAPGLRGVRPWVLSRGYAGFLVPPCLFLALFFLWPLATVILRSFTEPSLGLGNYARVFGGGPYLRVLAMTLETAATVTFICLLVAYPVAFVVSRLHGTLLRLAFGLVLIPFWTSVVIRTYAWMVLFQRQGVLNDLLIALRLAAAPVTFIPSTLGVHIGMVHIMLPFMILPLVATMRGVDQTLLRAAEILGASPVKLFLRIYLPLTLPGVGAGVALVFITSLGFFVTPALLGGPQNMMAAVLIEEQASTYLNWPLASALATTLLIVTSAIYLAYARLTRGGPGGGDAMTERGRP